MLTIYFIDNFKEIEKSKFVNDVDCAFGEIEIPTNNQLVLKAVRGIAHARVLEPGAFIDEFGYKLPIQFLPTGCKAAIIAMLKPENIINLSEAGRNAVNLIVSNIKNGAIYIPAYDIDLYNAKDDTCDVMIYGKDWRFTSIRRLNYYIKEEMGLESYVLPDMTFGGIERLGGYNV